MASNRIKDLVIDIGDLNEQIAEALEEAINNISIEGVGDDQNTNFDLEDVSVKFVKGQFVANIDLQRTEGKFCSNADLEDAVIAEIGNQTITITVQIQA
jgi:hypothetical protein